MKSELPEGRVMGSSPVTNIFGRIALRVVDRSKAVAGAGLVLAVLLASQIPYVRTDVSPESYLDAASPARVVYDQFRREFDRDDLAIIVVESPQIFEIAFLERLKALHDDIDSRVPHVDEITSLLNARSTRGEGDDLIVGDLIPRWPPTPSELEEIEKRARANPLYRDTLLSADSRMTAVHVRPLTYREESALDALAGFGNPSGASPSEPELLGSDELRALVEQLRAVVTEHDGPGFRLHMAGLPISTERISRAIERDSMLYTAVAGAAIAGLLWLIFRQWREVLLPLAVVGAAVVGAQGLMGWLGVPLSAPLQIVSPLLLAVGVCGAVHVQSAYDHGLRLGLDRDAAVVHALEHSGLAVCMASITTAAGLLSFLPAELEPVAALGVIAPLGVLLTLVYSLLVLPALLVLLPRPDRPSRLEQVGLDAALSRAAAWVSRRPGSVVALFGLLMAMAVPGMLQLRFGMWGLGWLPETDSVRLATELIDGRFGGTQSIEILVETGEDEGVHNPALLSRIEQFMRQSEGVELGPVRVTRATSVVDVLKEIHQALHGNDSRFHRLPEDRALVAQELLLFENAGSDDVGEVVDSRRRTARISLRAPDSDSIAYGPFLERLQRDAIASLGEDVEIRITGMVALLAASFSAVVVSLARSYVLAIVVIVPLLVLLIGDLRLGLLSIIPNLLPVLAVLGLMGWLDIPLDASTLLVGSIVLGIAVDDTIHFFLGFRRQLEETQDVDAAIRSTLHTKGVALLATSIVLSLGFLSFTLATMSNVVQFGLLAAFATAVAFLCDVLLAPALIVLALNRRALPLNSRWKLTSGSAHSPRSV